MANNKRSFLLYIDIYHTVKKLTDDQSGKLFKHILSYVNDENPVINDILLDLVFEPIKQQLKRDLRKYEIIREKRSLAGKASADKRQQMLTSDEQEQQVLTNSTVNDNVNVNDTVNVNDNVKEKERKSIFESFRINYPGTKRGLLVEFENFQKKHKDWKNVLQLLEEKLTYQKSARNTRKLAGGFVPEWKNLQTWINQRCWEEEINIESPSKVAEILTYEEILKMSEKNPDIWKQYSAVKRDGERKAVFILKT